MSEIENVNWNYPTPIWFGLDRSLEIANALESLSMQNPLLVTDPDFSTNKNFTKIVELLKNNKIQHISKITKTIKYIFQNLLM